MAFIRTIPPDQATGRLKEVYDAIDARHGLIPQMRQIISLRPDAMDVLTSLWETCHMGGTSLGTDREEMIAIVVAGTLKCSYCTIAHGGSMVKKGSITEDQAIALACNYSAAGLSAADTAMLDYAVKIALDPESVTADDVERVRAEGFDDVAILDIALASSYRVFVTRLAAALGIDGDDWFDDMDERLLTGLSVGKRLPTVDMYSGKRREAGAASVIEQRLPTA